ncbi:hypothetical protein [Streptomyces sp. NPDC058279]|uniref:hypothetical protein n=1 Tax=Streptomyces sp. NPDC058279 TaxID=3346418 RepID=UPI0036E7B33A
MAHLKLQLFAAAVPSSFYKSKALKGAGRDLADQSEQMQQFRLRRRRCGWGLPPVQHADLVF